MKKPRAIVAIILALTVMVFVVGNVAIRMLVPGGPPEPYVVEAWEIFLAGVIGALAGYISGGKMDD